MRLRWRVRELAERKRLAASQLARASGLDEKTVRNILSGKATRVDLDTIAKLAGALGVPPGALWDAEPAPAWDATAGAAGTASGEELDAVLHGRWATGDDPGLERVQRP